MINTILLILLFIWVLFVGVATAEYINKKVGDMIAQALTILFNMDETKKKATEADGEWVKAD